MKRAVAGIVLLVVFALVLGVAAAWLFFKGGLRGDGEPVTVQRPLAPFTAVRIDGVAAVILVQGSTESITIDVPARQRGNVRAEVKDGVLRIRNDESRRWWSSLFGGASRTPQISIAFRQLQSIALSGAVKLRSDRLHATRLAISVSGAGTLKMTDLDTDEVRIDGSGAVKADLAGRTRRQDVSISGAADYRGGDLVSERADLEVSGAGRVLVHAEKILRVSLSGAATVEYIGNPQVTEEISGVGRIRRRDASATVTTTAIAQGA